MKQKILLLLSLYGMLAIKTIAQQEAIIRQKIIGGSAYDEARCILKTRDGGTILGGRSYSNKSGQKTQNTDGDIDYWIVKTDSDGKIEWDKTIGGYSGDFFESMIETSDGGYALVGVSYSNTSIDKDDDSHGNGDAWVVKLDNLGNIQWNKTIGGSGEEAHFSILQASDEGYILAGFSGSDISGDKTENSRGDIDYWVVKLDKNGRKIWDKTIGGNSYDLCTAAIITSDGGLALAGYSASDASGEKSENSRGFADVWIVKLAKSGKIEWDKTLGGSDYDFGSYGLLQTDDDGYLIGASSYSNISGEKTENNRGGSDWWLIRLDKKGNKIWDKTIGGNGDDNDFHATILRTEDNGYLLGSSSNSDISGEKTEPGRGGLDYWTIKLDKNLHIQWDRTIGGSEDDYLRGQSLQEIKKNVYALAGTSWSPVSGDKKVPLRGEGDYWPVVLDANAPFEVITNSNIKYPFTAKKNYTVYPIPVKDKIYVRVNGTISLMLTDSNGKQVLTQKVKNNDTVNVANIAAGTYYLKNSERDQTEKIMIVK